VRPLIVTELISLDGVVEAPGDAETTHPQAGWTTPYRAPESYAFKLKETLDAQSLLLGRITYEGFAAGWPTMSDVFADKMNSMPKHVVTNSLTELEWNATPISGDIVAGVTELKQGEGGPILVHGSATLVRFLIAEHLVDELHLMLFPVVVGGGQGMFPDDRVKLSFELTELTRYDSGAVLQIYRPVA
jgi:dihydrofolate reductase